MTPLGPADRMIVYSSMTDSATPRTADLGQPGITCSPTFGNRPLRYSRLRHRLSLYLVLAFAAAIVCASDLLDEKAFTGRYVELMTELHPGLAVEIQAPLDVVVNSQPKSFRLFLDNAYLEYRAQPDAIDRIIRHHIGSLEAVVADRRAPPSAGRIVPVIKGDAFVAGLEAQVRENGKGELTDFYVMEPLAEGLHVFYVFDYEDSVQYVSADDLARLELAPRELRGIAVKNLSEMLTDLKREGNDRWWFMVADGNYEASLILLDGLWNKQNFEVNGEPVVFVLARDTVLIIGSEDTEAFIEASKLADEAAAQWPYFISPHAYVHGAGGWSRYVP